MILYTALQHVIAFGLGSIPFGIIVCQAMGLSSPKSYGSKNIGASNVARQNLKAGALTLLLDAAKGFLAVKLLASAPSIIFAVVVGHCYSPILRFNGGKGIATAGGALVAAFPAPAIVLLSLWATVFMRSRIPARASIATTILLLIYGAIGKDIWLVLTSLVILIRHIPNVRAAQPA